MKLWKRTHASKEGHISFIDLYWSRVCFNKGVLNLTHWWEGKLYILWVPEFIWCIKMHPLFLFLFSFWEVWWTWIEWWFCWKEAQKFEHVSRWAGSLIRGLLTLWTLGMTMDLTVLVMAWAISLLIAHSTINHYQSSYSSIYQWAWIINIMDQLSIIIVDLHWII
jgi:hypothetical protein